MSIRKGNLDSKTAKAYEAWRAEFSVEDLLKYTEGGKDLSSERCYCRIRGIGSQENEAKQDKEEGFLVHHVKLM